MATKFGTAGDDDIDLLLPENAGFDDADGLGGDDRIRGNSSNNVLDGGAGSDTAVYIGAPTGVTVNLSTGTAADGYGATDTLQNFERIDGSSYADTLTGDAGDNSIQGRGGADTIDGGAGQDSINYFAAPTGVTVNLATGTAADGYGTTDTLVGIEGISGSFNSDTLIGDAGDNYIDGRGGNDLIDGGAGFDSAGYIEAPTGVTVNLANGTATDGHGTTDTLINVEGVFGSSNADTLTGDAGNNSLAGSSGDDTVAGGGGYDTLDGGTGTDTAVFDGNRADYAISGTASALTIADGTPLRNGTDTVRNVELVQFADGTFSVADLLNSAPSISTTTLSAAENQTAAGTAVATDPDTGQTLTYSIVPTASGGAADSDKFTINAATGALAFLIAPDFEAPTDAGGNNVYDVTVQVSDGNGGIDTQVIAVSVTNANEAPQMGGQGNLDIVTANFYSNNVSVLLGDGTGSFTSSIVGIAGGSAPASVALGDVNNDGMLDIMTANQGSSNVSLLLANGLGGFNATTTGLGGGVNSSFITLADINHDDHLDAVVASDAPASAVSILQGDGQGGFTATTVPNGGSNTAALAVGDVNGDGNIDVVTANLSSDDLSLLLGDGAGNFTASTVGLNGGVRPFSVALGDLNGDGKLDVVAANQGTSQVSILLGNGTGGFNVITAGTGSFDTYSVALGDVNSDGKVDIVTANRLGNNVSILLGDGTGNFSATTTGIGAGANPWVAALGDFDGDGDLDIATSNQGSNNVSVLLGDGAGSFTPSTVAPVGANPIPIAIGNVNNDISIAENTTLVTTLVATDPDAGQTLTYSIVPVASGGAADSDKFTINAATGALAFITAPNFESPADAGGNNVYDVTVQVSDGNGGIDTQVIAVTVTDINEVPTTTPVTLAAIAEDSGARLITQAELLANATDVDSATLTATGLATGGGSLVDNGNGTWSYTPALDDDSQVTFSYTVTDGSLIATGAATLDITPVNDAPVFSGPAAFVTSEDASLVLSGLSVSDVDAGDAIIRVLLTMSHPFHGSLAVTNPPPPGVTAGSQGPYYLEVTGTQSNINAYFQTNPITFTPDENFSGSTACFFVVSDFGATGEGLPLSGYLNGSFNITSVNDAPAAGNDSLDRWQELQAAGFSYNSSNGHWYKGDSTARTWDGAVAFAAAAGGYLATITDSQENGFVSNLTTGYVAWLGGSDAAVEGTWVWQTGPEAGQAFWQTPGTTFIYANWHPAEPNNAGNEDHLYISPFDNGQWVDFPGTIQAAGTVIEVGGRAGDGSFTNEDTAQTIAAAMLLANDTDPDAGTMLTITAVSATSALGATVTLNGADIVYDPTAAASLQALEVGQFATDTFSYTASDGQGGTTTATVTLSVSGLADNHAPMVGNDDLTALKLQSAAYNYNAANGHWYRVEHGASTGALTYAQTDALTASYGGYLATITDGQENAFIHGIIQGIPLNGTIGDPYANRGAWIGGSDAAVEGTWVWQTGPEAGQTFWTAPGTTQIYASWNPAEPNNVGNEDHVFMGNNGNWFDFPGGNAVAGYVIENEVGRAGDGSFTNEDTAQTIAAATLLANDADPDAGTTLTITAVSATSALGASVTLVGGTITYDPTGSASLQALGTGQFATDTFTYTVSDGQGGTTTATVTLTVSGLEDNGVPVITSNGGGATATVSAAENTSAVTTVAATDPDAGQTLAFSIVGGADLALFTINAATGALAFLIAPDFEVPQDAGGDNIYDVTAQVSDGNGGTDTQAIAVTVDNILGLTLSGNGQANTLTGTGEEDVISGFGGGDTLQGLGGNDRLDGGAGADRLDGGAGLDTLIGGLGNDTFVVDGLDVLQENAGEGTDTIETALLTYSMAGVANVENLTYIGASGFSGTGNGLANVIRGGAGGDTLDGGAGSDRLIGFGGDDTYLVDVSGDVVVEASGAGVDTVRATSASFSLSGNVENLIYVGSGSFTGSGNGLANLIVGGLGSDILSGAGGDDRLEGAEASDTLNGGAGNDTLIGGAANDIMNGGGGSDSFVFAAGFGADTIAGFDANLTGGQDFLDVTGLGINAGNFAARVLIADLGSDMRVTVDGVDTILLTGVSGSGANTITQADFLLA